MSLNTDLVAAWKEAEKLTATQEAAIALVQAHVDMETSATRCSLVSKILSEREQDLRTLRAQATNLRAELNGLRRMFHSPPSINFDRYAIISHLEKVLEETKNLAPE